MHPRARALVDELYEHPHRLDTLEAVRRELDAPRHAADLAEVLRWWATYAPDDTLASQVLLDAARRLASIDPQDPAVLATLIAALERDPSHEQAAQEVRMHLERARDFQTLEQVFTEWALATRREGCSPTVCALASFMLAHLRVRHTHDLDGAIEALCDALRAFPEHPEAKRALSGLYARRARKRVVTNERAARDDRHRAAQLLYELGMFDIGKDAISDLQRALDLVPDHSGALETLLRRLGGHQLPVRRMRLQAFVNAAPDRVQTHRHRFELVRCLFRERRYADAVPHLRFLSDRGYADAEEILTRLCPDPERASQPPLPQKTLPPVYDSDELTRHDVSRLRPEDAEHAVYTVSPETAPTEIYDQEVRKAALAAIEREADNDAALTKRRATRSGLRRVTIEHTLGLTVVALTSLVALTSYLVGAGH